MTPSCGMTKRRNTACVKALTLQIRVLHNQFSVSSKGEKNLLIRKETLWKNNLDFVKDVPMIHVHCIITELQFVCVCVRERGGEGEREREGGGREREGRILLSYCPLGCINPVNHGQEEKGTRQKLIWKQN